MQLTVILIGEGVSQRRYNSIALGPAQGGFRTRDCKQGFSGTWLLKSREIHTGSVLAYLLERLVRNEAVGVDGVSLGAGPSVTGYGEE